MEECVFVTVTIIGGVLAAFDYTTDLYTSEHEMDKSGIGAGIDSLVGAGISTLFSSKKDHGRSALIDVVVGAIVGGDIDYYMSVQEAKLHEEMQGTGISMTRNDDNIILDMSNNITFDSSNVNLKPTGVSALVGVAVVLKEYSKAIANVLGFTNSAGSQDLNTYPSQQRADSVVSALITQGVTANRIHTQGMGPANPIASNSTAEGKAQNRRVGVTLNPIR